MFMCIAFPKAADGNEKSEPAWKSMLLLLPRLVGLLWLMLKILGGGLKNWLQDRLHTPA
ncbi:hypothetical protein [Thiolapillus sp.]|uniref:hypothetical protein n=1 Tax=Thiolapillus sp. TaxID=2017437 RepID=UPI0025D4DB62